MRLLLDSHTMLWWRADDKRLSERAQQAIESPEARVYFSSASIWELAIKQAKGKLKLPVDLRDALLDEGIFEILVSSGDAFAAAALPPHHGDPFDRMLVAQARAEGLTIVTRDPRIAAYGVPVLW